MYDSSSPMGSCNNSWQLSKNAVVQNIPLSIAEGNYFRFLADWEYFSFVPLHEEVGAFFI